MVRIGPYEPLGELGRGATGTVLRARDAAGREVALKVLRPDAVTPRVRKRFLQEVRAMARIRHPNVVGIVDVGESPAGPYLAMELVRGPTLAARLAQGGRLPVQTAARLAEQLAVAAAEVHAAGLVHRDINPRNVLLRDPGGEPVLTDLGLAGELDPRGSMSRVSVEGRFLGTPGFWPPEQARGALGEIGPASDLYAIGATLYAMLTGQPPFVVETLEDALRVVSEDPRPPSSLRPDLDPELEAVVLRCLARRPQDRYPSALALAAALRAARRERRGQAAGRRSGRRALGLGGGALALALALAGGWAVARGGAPAPLAPGGSAPLAPGGSAPLAPATEASPPATEGVRQAPEAAPPATEAAPPATEAIRPVTEVARLDPEGAAPGVGLTETPPRDAAAEADVAALLASAREHLRAGDIDAGERAVEQALARSPDHPEGLLYLSLAASQRGDGARALALLDRAVARAPGLARPVAQRGILRFEQGDAAGSLVDLTRALELDDTQALVWHNRALAHLALEDPTGALRDEERALALAPGHAPAHYIRARAHRALGDLAAAEAAAGQAVGLRPAYAAAWLLRAEVRAQRGDVAGARADARQAAATAAPGSGARADAERLLAELDAGAAPR